MEWRIEEFYRPSIEYNRWKLLYIEAKYDNSYFHRCIGGSAEWEDQRIFYQMLQPECFAPRIDESLYECQRPVRASTLAPSGDFFLLLS